MRPSWIEMLLCVLVGQLLWSGLPVSLEAQGTTRARDLGVVAGWFNLNGNGEMTGTAWVEDSGFLTDPVYPRCGEIQTGDPQGAESTSAVPARARAAPPTNVGGGEEPGGPVIIVVATDAPLLPHQLSRVARRAGMGLARLGSIAANASGDLFLAFSTANPEAGSQRERAPVEMLPNGSLNPVFEATIQATEEAILNSLIAAETMVGADHIKVHALPHDRLRQLLDQYNRLERSP